MFYEPLDDEDRPGFIRKVYGILSMQLIFTVAFSWICMYMQHNDYKDFVYFMVNPAVFFMVIGAYIISIIGLTCCNLDTMVPINYILLSIFTFCVSWMVGVACMACPNPLLVFQAATLTAAMVIGLTFYAVTTKTDFTYCGASLFILGMVFCTACLFACVFGPTMNLGIACLGVMLFSFYLVYDT